MIFFLLLGISMGLLVFTIVTGLLLLLILFIPDEDLIQTEGKRARQIIDQITHEFLDQVYSQSTNQEEQNESLK